jgi:DNA repair and recombination protein RAD54B
MFPRPRVPLELKILVSVAEYVVFVKPTSLQKSMFTRILQPDVLNSLIGGSTARSLAMITMLTKLSNSPVLLKSSLEKRSERVTTDGSENVCEESAYEAALNLLPSNARLEDVELSGSLPQESGMTSLLISMQENSQLSQRS